MKSPQFVKVPLLSVLKNASGRSISRILSSAEALGRSSIWLARRRAARAAYPGLAF